MNMDPRPTSFLFENHLLPSIHDQLKELSSFLQTTESFLDSLRKNKLDEFIKYEHDLGVETLPDGTSFEAFFNKHYGAWSEGRLTKLLRRSFLISLYSFTEYSLLDICRFLRRKDVRVSVSDIKGQNDIDKAKIYIAKVLCADFPSTSSQWGEIQVSRRIRNCIVHNSSEVEESNADRKPIEDYIKANNGMLSLSGNEIILESEYCAKMLKITAEFFVLLRNSLLNFVQQNENNLEPPNREFGEYYIGRPIRVIYVPPPSVHRNRNDE
jgi:hypothetical protein